ncbi:hypothetical protein E1281_16840 [Actinomadura sp. KC345]|uniref:hypothetical protein n=1 Tax=Actinomadura sp. KC345 TaxID=2530371 RepID=UPI00104CDF2D|nr:hypothetical protein [Actinomadura sp. KC345]TDC54029.1 hypothetical protein E1281_16840 [Actinomadura sp. KC345]
MKDDRRWLDEPRNVDRVVHGLYLLCALVFLADLLYAKHPHFDVENLFGFYAVFGFVGSVTLVLVAKQLRRVLMRGEDYYERPERTGDDD